MPTFIALIPALFTSFVAFFRNPEKAFYNLYLPILLLIPQVYYAQTEGFPKLNSSDAAIIPIFLAFLRYRVVGWRFSVTDLIIVIYIMCGYYSEYLNTDAHYANNKLATTLCRVLAPYVLAKGLIHKHGLTVPFAKRLVFLMFVNALISCVYELRFIGIFQTRFLDPFFPGQTDEWPALFRYGILRIRGPFMQTILYGIGLSVAILVNIWLTRTKIWKPNFKHLPPLPIEKGYIITCGLVLGLLFTFSRGPMLACITGLIIQGSGFSRKPFKSLLIRLTIAIAFSAVLIQSFLTFTDIDPLLARNDSEANIAYRGKVFRNYLYFAWLSPAWGWGTEETPMLSGIHSIDNQYLLIFLQKGLVGLGLYLLLLFWMMVRLLIRGIKTSSVIRTDSSFAITLMTVFFVLANCFLTVYMGLQIEVFLFLFAGWAEGFLKCKPEEIKDPEETKEKKMAYV